MSRSPEFPPFAADLDAPGMLHATFVRSPHACARINRIDIDSAVRLQGIKAVWTGADLAESGLSSLPVLPFRGSVPGAEARLQPGLASGEVEYEGQPLAIVIAESAAAAEQAAEQVGLDLVRLPSWPVPPGDIALPGPPGGARVEGRDGSLAVALEYGDADLAGSALSMSAVTATLTIRHPAHHPISLEPRACLARNDERSDILQLHLSHESPHLVRALYSRMLRLPESRLRVVARRVGGGFGARRVVTVEEAVVAWTAMRLGRPVQWIGTRAESFLSDPREAEARTVATMGFDGSGAITALEVECHFNVGAYLSTFGPAYAERLVRNLMAAYPLPAFRCSVRGHFTNTTPTDVIDNDGAGAATLILERLLDTGARRLGMDPATLRKRNRDRTGYGATPSGTANLSSEATLDRALERAGYDAFRDRPATGRVPRRYIGVGISCYSTAPPSEADSSQDGPWHGLESGFVRVHIDGSVSAYTGRAVRGGDVSESAITLLLAEQLGVAETDIVVVAGDTDASPFEVIRPGGGSLRAMLDAASMVRRRAVRLAAEQLGVGEGEIRVTAAGYSTGHEADRRTLSLADVAAIAYDGAGGAAGLEATVLSAAAGDSLEGAHVAIVEIDGETGRLDVTRYVAVDEIGTNGAAAEIDVGIRGSISRGVHRALREETRYRTTGELGTVSLMTYPVPFASVVPEIETEQIRSQSAKRSGVDPGGIVTSAAIANAVADALSPLGIEHLDMPYTPERIWEAIRRANQGAG